MATKLLPHYVPWGIALTSGLIREVYAPSARLALQVAELLYGAHMVDCVITKER